VGLFIFKGEDSLGYIKGQKYPLHIVENSLTNRIFRGWKKDWQCAIVSPFFCPYSSWEKFYDNWEKELLK
jgi:hypothetical protein